ncbi:hypothetical protein OS493_014955 [Desmophyllum pertusum]|uniref:Uncharacterized protein n=1 Tax=Desmophyllum pertusum TaxID=174260 RepID=A0A9X0A5K6_9CNID|nr:hypothetical protein OS493_014955 [Desmophyllum pertusum]
MNYLKEQLEAKGVNFDAARLADPPELSIEVQADTVYIQGPVQLLGIRSLKIFTRAVIGGAGSELDVSAPIWSDGVYTNRVTTGREGDDGKDGFNGPTVEIFADEIQGAFRIIANGGDGLRGQNGGNGVPGQNNNEKEADKKSSECTKQSASNCLSKAGQPGVKGRPGGNAGNSGTSGDGGDSGTLTVLVARVDGNVELRSCKGSGAQPGTNGRGGQGGLGSIGGKGVTCYSNRWDPAQRLPQCIYKRQTGNAARGPRGNSGRSGNTPNTPGSDGSVSTTSVQSRDLDAATKLAYPVTLLRLIKRHSEDLLWANDLTTARKVLTFLKQVSADREDARDIYKEAKRKLAFVGKEGFDMFGNNVLFAPRIEWEVLLTVVEGIKEYATDYEKSYNNMRERIEAEEDFQQLAAKMSSVAEIQVQAERDRLVEARNIAESEKALYARAIGQLEDEMDNIVRHIESDIAGVISASQFNVEDFLAVLQGTVGFVSGAASGDIFEVLGPAVELATDLSSKLTCPTGSLEEVLQSMHKWLTFGNSYNPLEDSSDLDFDQVDIESVPEMMQANLEINKESLTAQLVCLLEVNSREQDVAQLKQYIEQFFISGSTRIDLIGKCIDLDNEIGGYNFDIPLLEETQLSLTSAKQPQGISDTEEVRLQFLEHLLSTYQEMEGSFMKEVYELYKGFRFRTLWETDDPLPQFQRVASEGAQGGRLNAIVELTNVLTSIQSLEADAVTCFSNNRPSTGIQRWSFSTTTHESMFNELRESGSSRFTLNIKNTCPTCFNVRLEKLYIELKGQDDQPESVPDTVHLLVRHLSASFFRNGDGSINEYRQPLGSFRKMKFRRFAISDETKCREEERNGNRNSIYCVYPSDGRLQLMCNQPTSQGACTDSLLGEEECRSPYGTYELVIPVDNDLSCDHPGMTNKNCQDLQLSSFDTMNVWALFYYWSDAYPSGRDHQLCRQHAG